MPYWICGGDPRPAWEDAILAKIDVERASEDLRRRVAQEGPIRTWHADSQDETPVRPMQRRAYDGHCSQPFFASLLRRCRARAALALSNPLE